MMLDKQLSRFADECERVRTDHWRLALKNGRAMSVSVKRSDGFLLFDAGTGIQLTAENLAPLAECWRELPATVKLAVRRNASEVRLRSEFPLPEESDVSADRVREHLDGMRNALHSLSSCEAAAEEMACPEPEGDGQAINGSLAEVLQEAGWPFHERPGGALLADLETGSEFLQAEVGRCAGNARLRVTLHRDDEISEDAQQALCLYLLEANAALRYVRAFLQRDSEGLAAGFEVHVGGLPTAAEAGHALAALSVAARQCVREVKVLGGSMAGIYRSARPPFITTAKELKP